MEFIDLKTQYQKYKKQIDEAIHRVLDGGQYILGKEVGELEKQLAEYIGVKHCISAASGTDTLFMALLALGIGKGDEVITTPFTFVATLEAIELTGARSVLVDIEPESYNIDPKKIEAAITPRTKAIMPVSLFGQMPNMERINEIAKKKNLAMVEDAAQSFGAERNGKKSCGTSLVGSTSFFPSKPLGCYGDGGALFTNDDALAKKLIAIRVHGSTRRYYHEYLGINGRLDTLQAAILLAKFAHFPQEVEARKRIGARYSKLLGDCCKVPQVMPGNSHVYAQYTIRIPNRDVVAQDLKEKGIPTTVHYPLGMHEQPAYAYLGYKQGAFPETEAAAREVLSLPMHPWLNEKDQDFIVAGVKEALASKV